MKGANYFRAEQVSSFRGTSEIDKQKKAFCFSLQQNSSLKTKVKTKWWKTNGEKGWII